MLNLSNFEIRKLKLEGNWCTEDDKHLKLRVFFVLQKKTHFANFVMRATSSSSKGQKKFQRKNTS